MAKNAKNGDKIFELNERSNKSGKTDDLSADRSTLLPSLDSNQGPSDYTKPKCFHLAWTISLPSTKE